VVAQAIREHLGEAVDVRTATLDQPEQGLAEEALQQIDVLAWWGHAAHGDVADDVVARVHAHVLGGMGLMALTLARPVFPIGTQIRENTAAATIRVD
jgi:trehalose utilization protein